MAHVQDVILLEEDEDEESRLFSYDWLESPSKKHNDENRFVVVHSFTTTVLPIISRSLNERFNIFEETHFANFKDFLATSRLVWDNNVVIEKITKPVLHRIRNSVRFWNSNNA